MKDNKGFIATSLIYSFFLVFIAIMAALIGNFIANKTILLRYNEDLEDKKNRDTFNIKLTSRGSENFKVVYDEDTNEEIVDVKGQTLTNLIQDSEFVNDEFRWVKNGEIEFTPNNLYENRSGLLIRNSVPSSSVLQKNIMSIYGNKYYFSIEYASNYSELLEAKLSNTPSAKISLPSNNDIYKRVSFSYTESNETTGPYNIFSIENTGISDELYDTSKTKEAHFTKAMLIDLTGHYDAGREPHTDWLDENIEYFDGTINYLKADYIERNEEVIIKMYTTQKDFKNIKYLKCTGKNDSWRDEDANMKTEIKYDNNTSKYYGFLTLKNISDDIDCNLEWGV